MGENNIEAYLEALVDESRVGEKATQGEGSAGEGNGHSEDRRNESVEKKSKRRSRSRDKGDRGSRDRERRDRSRDHRDRDRERDRDRDRDRDRRDREKRRRSRSRSPRRRSRSRSREKSRPKKRSVSPEDERTKEQKELDELTKDQRTVFVSQLVIKIDEKDIKKFFSQFGKVRSVVMIRDKSTNRHKGFAYVEMADLDVIPAVLLMNNQIPDFQKFPILVSASRAEKNYMAKKEGVSATGKPAAGTRPAAPGPNQNRVYLGNLHLSLSDADLREFLKEFGTVTHILLQRDDQGVSKGYAFVTFSKPEEAQLVMNSLQGFLLLDRPLKVGPVTEITRQSGQQPAQQQAQQAASANWKLDDDGGAGMHMNAQNRVALMAKLGQTAGLPVPATTPLSLTEVAAKLGGVVPQPQAATAVIPAIGGSPSVCILVKNMFDPNAETEEGWELDIKEDVEEECIKHGTVLHSYVETKLPGGLVYLMFSTVDGATKAAVALNGRWFAGRMLTVDYIDTQAYVTKFPEAQSCMPSA